MRSLPTKKTVRCLFAAEGYLELELPERAIQALNRIEDAGELSPYASYLRGQALRTLERYDEAIAALQDAAESIPAPFNRQAWGDLSDCFRRQGLQELADVAEMFAEDPMGGADQDFSEPSLMEFLSESGMDEEFAFAAEWTNAWDRAPVANFDDFEDFNFEEDWTETDEEAPKSSPRTPPRK